MENVKAFTQGWKGANPNTVTLGSGFGALQDGIDRVGIAMKNVTEGVREAADNIPEITLPKDRWNQAVQHADDAMNNGHPDTYTIDRPGASARRSESLKGYPTKTGFDRDEWPPAVFKEGGEGASIRYISPSDNRGLGAYLRNQIAPYENGAKVKIKVK